MFQYIGCIAKGRSSQICIHSLSIAYSVFFFVFFTFLSSCHSQKHLKYHQLEAKITSTPGVSNQRPTMQDIQVVVCKHIIQCRHLLNRQDGQRQSRGSASQRVNEKKEQRLEKRPHLVFKDKFAQNIKKHSVIIYLCPQKVHIIVLKLHSTKLLQHSHEQLKQLGTF